jgi:hypothetical protein
MVLPRSLARLAAVSRESGVSLVIATVAATFDGGVVVSALAVPVNRNATTTDVIPVAQ